MPKYEYRVSPDANADAEAALDYRDAVKTAKRYAQAQRRTVFIDVDGEEELADFYYTVAPDGKVTKHF